MRTFLFSIALLGSSAWAFDTPKPAKSVKPIFEMSKETTVILEPLDKFGYPDYETALNLHLRGSIKPEDNACVKLWQAIGPKTDTGKPIPAKYWEWLEYKAPPEKGDYFIPAEKYLLKNGKKKFDEAEYNLDSKLTHEPWNADDHPEYANWLNANKRPLDITVEAVQRKSFFSPYITEGDRHSKGLLVEVDLIHIDQYRKLVDALLKRAMLRIKLKKFDDAWKDIQACHRLARHVANGMGNIELLVGIAMDSKACEADVTFLEHVKPKDERLIHFRNDLDKLPPIPFAFEKLDLAERYAIFDLICRIRQKGLTAYKELNFAEKNEDKEPEYNHILDEIKWSDTFRTLNQWFDRKLKVMKITDRAARKNAWEDYHKLEIDLRVEMFKNGRKKFEATRNGRIDNDTGRFFGHFLFVLMSISSVKVEQACEKANQSLAITQLAFTLAAYHEAKGAYPDKLDQLVPTYVKAMPVDLFSGKAPIYRKTEKGYKVYSVGLNEKDDGGKLITDIPNGNEPRGDDIGIRMPATKE